MEDSRIDQRLQCRIGPEGHLGTIWIDGVEPGFGMGSRAVVVCRSLDSPAWSRMIATHSLTF